MAAILSFYLAVKENNFSSIMSRGTIFFEACEEFTNLLYFVVTIYTEAFGKIST